MAGPVALQQPGVQDHFSLGQQMGKEANIWETLRWAVERDGSQWVSEQLRSQIRNAHDNKEVTGNEPAGHH